TVIVSCRTWFFFSSRRRHTRSYGDWSSDVCSSDLTANVEGQTVKVKGPKGAMQVVLPEEVVVKVDAGAVKVDPRNETKRARSMRSEESRVGKEWRSGWGAER